MSRQLGFAVAIALAAALLAGCGPLLDPEATQEQARVPAARPGAGQTLGQTFVARRAGLAAVDLLLAVYPPGQGDDAGDLVVHLRVEPGGPDLATRRIPVAGLQHNSYLRLPLPPQPDSAGRRYAILVEATTGAPARATVWSAGADVLPDGQELVDGQPVAGDLAFRAYYDYAPARLAADVAAALGRRGWICLPALAALLLPGLALQRRLLPDADLDAAESLGLWLGLSLAVAPVALLLTTLAGLRVGPVALLAYLAAAGAAALPWQWPPFAHGQVARPPVVPPRAGGRVPSLSRTAVGLGRALSPAAGALLAAAGALLLRYVHAKDLALPMWGDSVHHTLIADLIAAQGRVPDDYGPLLPPQPFTYHFGFHVQAAALHLLTGTPGATAVLFIGQLLSGLLVFPAYLLASRLTGDRRAGLVAGLIVGLVSVLPAYSVTWGRYPQLAGLAALPAAVYAIERALAARRGRTGAIAEYGAAAVAGAGLVLTHPRVALLFGCYLLAWLLLAHTPLARALVGRGGQPDRAAGRPALGYLRPWLRVALVAALAGALVAPWLARLALSRGGADLVHPGPATPFSFPVDLLTTGFDRYLLGAALAGLGLDALLRRRAGSVVGLWVALGLLAANVQRLGLPISLALSNDALAIALFLPVAVLDGALIAALADLARLRRWPRPLRVAPAGLLLALGVWGGQNLAGVVNPVCLLATAADLDAIRWVEANTPPDAAFLINSFRWQGGMYMGSDGGYWLGALAGRRTSLPPLPYYLSAPEEVTRIRRLAEATQADRLDAADLPGLMRAANLTYVFVGSRGGPLTAAALARSPGLREVYANGRASVFALVGPAGEAAASGP